MIKRCALFLCILFLIPLAASAEYDSFEYIGNMEVVNCSEWVSLRESPRTTAKRLVKVSLGSIVHDCYSYSDEWCYAEYDGYGGYILAEYLQPSEGRLTFDAMMITVPGDGAPFYATIDSREIKDFIPANTIVRNCCIMDNARIYVEWGERCGFVDLNHAEVYNEMLHFPKQITLYTSPYDEKSKSTKPSLKIAALKEFPIMQYDYSIYEYDEYMEADSEDLPKETFVLYSDNTVNKVHLFNAVSSWDEYGNVIFEATLEHIQPRVDPDHPLLVGAVIWGDTPNLIVSYEDERCAYHFAFVEISGEDGSLLLREF